ncbi:TPA: hypothetical protein ACSY8M_09205 [Listeria monocytogenes]|nr:hypothetical protein [Listeria monocytogenes]
MTETFLRVGRITLSSNGQIKGKWIIHSSFSASIAIHSSPYYT